MSGRPLPVVCGSVTLCITRLGACRLLESGKVAAWCFTDWCGLFAFLLRITELFFCRGLVCGLHSSSSRALVSALIQVSWEVALWGHLATSEVELTSWLLLAAVPLVALLWVGLRVPRESRLGVSGHPVVHNLSPSPAGPCAQGVHKGSLAAVQVLVPREAKSKLAPEISVSLGETLGHNAVGGTPPFPGINTLAPSPSHISWVETESQEWRRVRQVLRLSTGPLLGLKVATGLVQPLHLLSRQLWPSVLSFRYSRVLDRVQRAVVCPRACKTKRSFYSLYKHVAV